jgi:hypothetical protein
MGVNSKLVAVILPLLALLMCYRLYLVSELLSPPGSWCRDIAQDHMAARALDEGLYPYQPISQLLKRYVGFNPGCSISDHPTPHTLQAITLMGLLPGLSLLELSVWWLAAQVGAILTLSWLLWRFYLCSNSTNLLLLICFSLSASFPGFSDLAYGNYSSILTLLFGTVFLLEAGSLRAPCHLSKCCAVGVILGLTLALKISGWVFLAYFIVKGRWKVVAWCLATLIGTVTAVASYHSRWDLFAQFLEAGWQTRTYYSHAYYNQSLWSLGSRIFGGLAPTSVGLGINAPAYIMLPQAIPAANAFIGGSVVLLLMIVACRGSSFEHSFATLALLASVADPLSWEHNLLFSFLALLIIGKRVSLQKDPRHALLYMALCLAWFSASPQVWSVSHGEDRAGLAAPLTGIVNAPVVFLGVVLLLRLRSSIMNASETSIRDTSP